MEKDLSRYKGQFIQGDPKKIKPPGDNDLIFYDVKLQVNSYNGWIPPKRGAI